VSRCYWCGGPTSALCHDVECERLHGTGRSSAQPATPSPCPTCDANRALAIDAKEELARERVRRGVAEDVAVQLRRQLDELRAVAGPIKSYDDEQERATVASANEDLAYQALDAAQAEVAQLRADLARVEGERDGMLCNGTALRGEILGACCPEKNGDDLDPLVEVRRVVADLARVEGERDEARVVLIDLRDTLAHMLERALAARK
jgi:hypothetical protein